MMAHGNIWIMNQFSLSITQQLYTALHSVAHVFYITACTVKVYDIFIYSALCSDTGRLPQWRGQNGGKLSDCRPEGPCPGGHSHIHTIRVMREKGPSTKMRTQTVRSQQLDRHSKGPQAEKTSQTLTQAPETPPIYLQCRKRVLIDTWHDVMFH